MEFRLQSLGFMESKFHESNIYIYIYIYLGNSLFHYSLKSSKSFLDNFVKFILFVRLIKAIRQLENIFVGYLSIFGIF